jgi:hypothetical protein
MKEEKRGLDKGKAGWRLQVSASGTANGGRPSPGAAMLAICTTHEFSKPTSQSHLGAPGDGRSPKPGGVRWLKRHWRSRLFHGQLVGIGSGERRSAQNLGLEAACFGRFRVSVGGLGIGSDRRRRRNFVRVDFGLADKGDAFFDHQFRGANVAKQFGLGLDVDFLPGDDIAVDLAADDNGGNIHIAFDDRIVAEDEGAFGLDITIQFSIEGQFAGKLEGAFEFDVRVEDVLGVSCWCAHIFFVP